MLTSRLAAHPRRTLIAVLLFVVLAGAIGGPVAGSLESSGGFVAPGADSEVAIDRIEAATGEEPGAGIVLLVDNPSPERLATVERELANVPGIASTDVAGRDLVTGTLRASAEEDDVAQTALDAFARADGVTVGGGAVAGLQIGETVGADLGRAELIAFPLLLLLSLLFFRGRATLMPLAVGVTTVLGTFLVLSLVNRVYGLSVFALNLVIGLGLGLAIDYTLFLVSRYREELAARGPTPGAIAATMATAGRTVAFSAVTVSAALITLVVFPQGFLKSMGIAGAIVAAVAALAALVIAPALFALWGAKLARPSDATDGGSWHRLAHAVMRRARIVAPLTALAMLALSLPALTANWSAIDSSVIPEGKSARTVADAVNRGEAAKSPMAIAVTAPAGARSEVQALADRVARVEGVERVAPVRYLGSDTWQVSAIASGDPSGPAAQGAVEAIRAIPAPFDVARRRRRRGVRRPAGGDRLAAAARDRAARRPDADRAVADDRLGRAADQGRRDERADGRRGAHAAGADLPGRAPDRAAGLHAQRRRRAQRLPRHRGDRVRALDRLRRVPARPDQGGARRRPAGLRGRRHRAGAHGPRGHGRGDPDGGRDRRLLDQLDLVHPADRRRHRDRRARRRVRRAHAARPVADGRCSAAGTGGRRRSCAACTAGSGSGRPRGSPYDERRSALPPPSQPDVAGLAPGGGPAAGAPGRGAADRRRART